MVDRPHLIALRERLSDQLYEAEQMKAWFEQRLRESCPGLPFDHVLQFAEWFAREKAAREAMDAHGFER